eukprot:3149189-Rhodomonas_salina.1
MAAGWGYPWVRRAFAAMSELRRAGETPPEARAELRRRDKEMALRTSKESVIPAKIAARCADEAHSTASHLERDAYAKRQSDLHEAIHKALRLVDTGRLESLSYYVRVRLSFSCVRSDAVVVFVDQLTCHDAGRRLLGRQQLWPCAPKRGPQAEPRLR